MTFRILVASILILCSLGVGVGLCLAYYFYNADPNYIDIDVLVANNCTIEDVDTYTGSIELVSETFPYDDGTLLPQCITQDMANEWEWIVNVIGGYTPKNMTGLDYGIFFYNKDGWIQGYNLVWEKIGGDCCTGILWRATVKVCNNVVCIPSNHYPDVPEGCDVIPQCSCCNDLNKKVDINILTKWEGCGDWCQQFSLILEHKRYAIKSPQLLQNFQ